MQCPKCGAALPAASRFCNTCGAAVSASPPPARPAPTVRPPSPQQTRSMQPTRRVPAPPGYPTGAPHPGAALPPMPPPGGQQAWGPAAGQPPPVAARSNKKPVLLLALLLLLVAGSVGAVGVALVRGKGNPVVGFRQAPSSNGPGVEQAVGAPAPNAPGIVTANGGLPVPGAPVTGQGKNPDGLAPSVVMGRAGTPNGASVTQVQIPNAPATPSAVGIIGPTGTPGPGMAQSAQAAPPHPPDNSDLDKYLQWLRYVEGQRQVLREVADPAELLKLSLAPLTAVQGAFGDDDNQGDPQQALDRDLNATTNKIVRAIREFHAKIAGSRARLVVPRDCQVLDNEYMGAVNAESQLLPDVLTAMRLGMQNHDTRGLMATRRRIQTEIYPRLTRADAALNRVYRGRGLDPAQNFKIDSKPLMDGGGGGLGGLGGIGLP
jgi:hypothetical protein